LGGAALSFFGLPALAAAADRPAIGFTPIAVSGDDLVRVPDGYTVQLLYAWGDPISDGPAFRADAGNSAAEQ
ncbi:MAG TPA: Tat pathway signal protein, partial [Candidatus Accumulibacter sp.]|nr:Tat pathway signal protein [Accumulibacter sp.]